MDGGGRVAEPLRRSKRTGAEASRARQQSFVFETVLQPFRPLPRGAPEPHGRGIVPLVAKLRRKLPRHAGVTATAVLILASAMFGALRGDHVETVMASLRDMRDATANAAGFRIAKLSITGTKQLNQDEVLAIGGITGRSSLLFLDAATVREKLAASPWISEVTVLKLLPDRLHIDLTERSAYALWQQNGQVSVIAEDGAVLEPYLSKRFTTLPLVVGAGANTQARDFFALLAQYPEVRAQVRAAIMVGERRWNLRLRNGIDVKLPDADPARALAMLAQLDRTNQLLTRDVSIIDMRLPDRIAVRLSDTAAAARAEVMKPYKNPKRKGDA